MSPVDFRTPGNRNVPTSNQSGLNACGPCPARHERRYRRQHRKGCANSQAARRVQSMTDVVTHHARPAFTSAAMPTGNFAGNSSVEQRRRPTPDCRHDCSSATQPPALSAIMLVLRGTCQQRQDDAGNAFCSDNPSCIDGVAGPCRHLANQLANRVTALRNRIARRTAAAVARCLSVTDEEGKRCAPARSVLLTTHDVR